MYVLEGKSRSRRAFKQICVNSVLKSPFTDKPYFSQNSAHFFREIVSLLTHYIFISTKLMEIDCIKKGCESNRGIGEFSSASF